MKRSTNTYHIVSDTCAILEIKSNTIKGLGFSYFIDIEDLPRVRALHWRIIHEKGSNTAYARSHFPIEGNPSISLHSFILSFPILGFRECIDHIDRNTLNNRKSNLRVVSLGLNAFNKDVQKSKKQNTPKGIYKTDSGKFAARYSKSGKTINIGTFKTIEEARLAYLSATNYKYGIEAPHT